MSQGIEISQLPLKTIIDPTDWFVIATLPYQTPGSNRKISGQTLLALRPQYFESCIQGTVNNLGGIQTVTGNNLILGEGEYIVDWNTSVIDGAVFGSNTFRIGFNTNSTITAYDSSDGIVLCSERHISLASATERIPISTRGRIIIPAGQTWIIKPTYNNVSSPIVTIGSEILLTALKIA